MSLWDDLSDFGAGALDTVGEGFDALVKANTTPTKTVNPNVQPQDTHQADNHGNKVTPSPVDNNKDKTLLYVGGALVLLLFIVLIVVLAKK